MTTISQTASLQAYPQIMRTPRLPAANQEVHADWAYDPVLDPTLNPALRAQYSPVEEVTVTAQKPAEESYSFWDVLDLINPLQHIPGVNTIYRELTGDTIKTPVQLVGATILGGPIGFAAAMVDSLIEESTGKDIGAHTLAMFKGDPALDNQTPGASETMLADAREFIPDAVAAPETTVADSREFIPEAAENVMANVMASASFAQAPIATPNRPVTASTVAQAPEQMAAATPAPAPIAPPGQTPNEAEAFVKTAQIAAQANVFPTFKRTNSTLNASAAQESKAQETAATANAVAAAGQMRFMPITRTGAERAVSTAPRRDGDATSTSELRARSKFAPGPVAMGRPALAPATLAVATASQNKTAATTTATAQQAYEYGRNAASTNGAAGSAVPAEMPAWFDSAMLGAIDKYKAMQEAR